MVSLTKVIAAFVLLVELAINVKKVKAEIAITYNFNTLQPCIARCFDLPKTKSSKYIMLNYLWMLLSTRTEYVLMVLCWWKRHWWIFKISCVDFLLIFFDVAQIPVSEAEPGLQIRGGGGWGGHPGPEIRRALRASIWSNNQGGAGSLTWIRHWILTIVRCPLFQKTGKRSIMTPSVLELEVIHTGLSIS